MVLCDQNKLYDPLRKKWIVATPEERVRYALCKEMEEKGYPKPLISLESNLIKDMKRRYDVVVYFRQGEAVVPLLLVECKAHLVNSETYLQVEGYNEHIKAPFVGVFSDSVRKVGAFSNEKKCYVYRDGLPLYTQLVNCVS